MLDNQTQTTPQFRRKVTLAERVAIAMTYDGRRRDWAPNMTEFGKEWWIAKATAGLNEVNRIIQARQK